MNNKQIGIVICNYNKSSYVVNCMQSLFLENARKLKEGIQ